MYLTEDKLVTNWIKNILGKRKTRIQSLQYAATSITKAAQKGNAYSWKIEFKPFLFQGSHSMYETFPRQHITNFQGHNFTTLGEKKRQYP